MASSYVSILLVWAVAGCTAAPLEPVKTSTPEHEVMVKNVLDSPRPKPVDIPLRPVIAVKAVGVWYGKPPLKQHKFDVQLTNASLEGTRWVVVPAFEFEGAEPKTPEGEVSELQIFELKEQPPVLVVKAIGAGLWAVRLPMKSSVMLRELSIDAWWDEVPDTVEFLGLVARELRIGGVPIATVVGRSLDSKGNTEVTAPKNAGDPRALKFWHPPDGKALPLTIDMDYSTRETVELIKLPGV